MNIRKLQKYKKNKPSRLKMKKSNLLHAWKNLVTKKEMTASKKIKVLRSKKKSCAVLLNAKGLMESWFIEKEITKRNKMNFRNSMNYQN